MFHFVCRKVDPDFSHRVLSSRTVLTTTTTESFSDVSKSTKKMKMKKKNRIIRPIFATDCLLITNLFIYLNLSLIETVNFILLEKVIQFVDKRIVATCDHLGGQKSRSWQRFFRSLGFILKFYTEKMLNKHFC